MLFESLLAGAAAGVMADRIVDCIDPDERSVAVQLLAVIAANSMILTAHSEEIFPKRDEVSVLRPYPAEIELPDYNHPHLSLFVPSQNTSGTSISTAQLRLMMPGVGILYKNVSCGWTQLDLPPGTMISTNDSNTYNCLLSYRNDALGSSL